MSGLTRILERLTYPLGMAWVLLGFGVVLQVLRWRRFGLALVVAGFGWLWIWSTPVFSDWIRGSLENRYSNLPAEQAPVVGAIVVLGGAFSHREPWPYPTISSAGDRYWHGARLFQAGRGEYVILSGGRSPGRGPGLTEAEAGAGFLRDMGVADDALLLDRDAMTTRENAVNVAALLEEHGIEDFLLVTSALHMRRSEAAFRGVGLDPNPVATGFEVTPSANNRIHRWLPSAASMEASSRAFHEVVGYWFYRVRGWV